MEHLTVDQLLDYFDGRLSEDAETRIEEHVAECSECVEAARAARHFAVAWNGWTAREHGAAHLRALLNRALRDARASDHDPVVRTRLARWAERWAGRAEVAVRIVVEASAPRFVAAGLEALTGSAAGWQFSPAPATPPIRGTPGRAGTAKEAVAVAPGARIVVSGDGYVAVRVDDTFPGGAPLVMLVPLAEGEKPRVATLDPRLGQPFRVARFEGLPAGEYLVAFEPLESAPGPVEGEGRV